MLRTTTFVLAGVLGAIVVGANPFLPPPNSGSASPATTLASEASQRPTLKNAAVTAADIPFREGTLAVERQLLELVNEDRGRAGIAPLALDDGLSRAALTHAYAMMDARQLSHQFVGEQTLAQRLVVATNLQLDMEGENVALDYDVTQAEIHLMQSPPHRQNLLNGGFNVIGFGVVQSGDHLYVVQDFGHALPNYSVDEVKERVGASVGRGRRQAGNRELARHDLMNADDVACSMARADKLGTSPVQQLAQRYTVLTFTTLRPEALPDGAAQAINKPNLRSFSVGACYARTETYPTGVYWVVLSLD